MRISTPLVLACALALTGCKGGGPAEVVPEGAPPVIDPEVEATKRAKAGLDDPGAATPPPRPASPTGEGDGTPWLFRELDEVNAPGRGPGRELKAGAKLVVHGRLLDPYAPGRTLAKDIAIGWIGSETTVKPDAKGAFQIEGTRDGTLALAVTSVTDWAVTRIFGPDFAGDEETPLQIPVFDVPGFRRLHEDLGAVPEQESSVLLVRVLSADLPGAPAATVAVTGAKLSGFVFGEGASKPSAGYGVEGSSRTVAFVNVPAVPLVITVTKADGTVCPGPSEFTMPPTHVYIADFACP